MARDVNKQGGATRDPAEVPASARRVGAVGVLRDIAFSALALAVAFCVILSTGAAALDGRDADEASALDARYLQALPELTPDAFGSGAFQSQFETFLSDHVPLRDAVIMNAAGLQRGAIRAANAPFGFDAFPTYYGSEFNLAPSSDMLFHLPYDADALGDERIGAYRSWFEENGFGEGERRWAFYLPDTKPLTPTSPVRPLMSQRPAYADACAAIESALPDGVSLVSLEYDAEEYPEKYLGADHHMQISGGIDLYAALCGCFGREPARFADQFVAYDGDEGFGYDTRNARCDDVSDVIYDVDFDMTGVQLLIDGVPAELSEICKGYAPAPFERSGRYADAYLDYFHYDKGLVEFRNAALEGAGSLLLVSDSYDNNCARFFSRNYEAVYELDPRHCDLTVREFLDAHPDVVDVAAVLCLPSLNQLLE